MRELERTQAFDREWLLIDLPTGTGYVNYAAVSVLEMLTRGNCATVAMQYAARPSPLSLDRVGDGHKQARLLVDAISERLRGIPAAVPPEGRAVRREPRRVDEPGRILGPGHAGPRRAGIDYAIWIGTPHFSQWKEQVLRDQRADVASELIGVFNDIGEWEATPPERRERMRYVMITHHNDGVARFGPGLLIQAPDWLGEAHRRWREIPKGMRWMPITTFFQVLVDMKNSANVVPGVFAATGHDYRADLLPFFRAILGISATDDQMHRLAAWLQEREVVRSEWVKNHGTADKSLAASLVVALDAREPGTRERDDHRADARVGARRLRRGRRCSRRSANRCADVCDRSSTESRVIEATAAASRRGRCWAFRTKEIPCRWKSESPAVERQGHRRRVRVTPIGSPIRPDRTR